MSAGDGPERPDLPPEVEALEGVQSAVGAHIGGADGSDGAGSRLRRATAFGIVIVSILAAVMAWRASVADESADATRVHAEQNRLAQQQLIASDETTVLHDLQLYERYAEQVDLARALERDGQVVRAQAQREAAAGQRALFEGTLPERRRDGSASFDAAYARSQQRLRDVELLNLHPPEELEA